MYCKALAKVACARGSIDSSTNADRDDRSLFAATLAPKEVNVFTSIDRTLPSVLPIPRCCGTMQGRENLQSFANKTKLFKTTATSRHQSALEPIPSVTF